MSIMQTTMLAAMVAAGAASAFQAFSNAALGRFTGDPLLAALFSFGSGFLLLAALWMFRGPVPGVGDLREAPAHALLGGAMGVVMVLTVILGVPRLGLLTTVTALVLGQLVGAMLLDCLPAFAQARRLTPERFAAAGLVFAGLLLSQR